MPVAEDDQIDGPERGFARQHRYSGRLVATLAIRRRADVVYDTDRTKHDGSNH